MVKNNKEILDNCWEQKLWANKCIVDVQSYENMRKQILWLVKIYWKEILDYKSNLDSGVDIDLQKAKELIWKFHQSLKSIWTDVREVFENSSQYNKYLDLLKYLDTK